MSNFSYPFSTMVGSWTKAMEDWQASCLAWQQAVTTIQDQRLRALGAWWQVMPQFGSRLMQNGPTTNGLETLLTWQGQTMARATMLACDMTAQRAHLLKQWRSLMLRNTPAGLDNVLSIATTLQSSATPTSSAPVSSSSSGSKTSLPASTSHASSSAQTSARAPQTVYGKMQPSVTSPASNIPTLYMKGTFYPAKNHTTTVTAKVEDSVVEPVNMSAVKETAPVSGVAPRMMMSTTLPAPTVRPAMSPASGFVPAGVAAEELEHAHLSSTSNSFARRSGGASLTRHSPTARSAKPSRVARGR